MEIARMNYYFTGLIILALTILALFVEPAYPRNEYLNEYGVRCGEMEIRVQKEETPIIIIVIVVQTNNKV
jgi:hypothetical protein